MYSCEGFQTLIGAIDYFPIKTGLFMVVFQYLCETVFCCCFLFDCFSNSFDDVAMCSAVFAATLIAFHFH